MDVAAPQRKNLGLAHAGEALVRLSPLEALA
jgi:hypothetical protein